MSTSPIPPVLDQDRYAVYRPTAATTDFALGFPLFGEAADVAVYLDGEPLALATDYTVRSTADGASLTPAPVSDAYVRLNNPIDSGKLEIFGNFRPRRTIQATAPYGTRDFNFAFSLLMAALREMWSKFTRALKVPVGEAELTIPSSEERAGQVLAFDAAGAPTVGGRYSDLMASAAAAAIAASNARDSAQVAAASAEAAAMFDPAMYSTSEQIAASFVPNGRKLKVGSGLFLDDVAGSNEDPIEGDLSADRLLSLNLTSKALSPETWVAGVDATEAPISPEKLALAISGLAPGVPAGTVAYFAGPTPPSGWLVRNGAALSRTAYSALFAAIGTTYGAGDGINTFNLPDGRGVFDRGLDGGRGLDSGRTLGSYQADAFASHSHTFTTKGSGSTSPKMWAADSSVGSATSSTGAAGGSETRPKNYALLAIIKY